MQKIKIIICFVGLLVIDNHELADVLKIYDLIPINCSLIVNMNSLYRYRRVKISNLIYIV